MNLEDKESLPSPIGDRLVAYSALLTVPPADHAVVLDAGSEFGGCLGRRCSSLAPYLGRRLADRVVPESVVRLADFLV